MNESFFPLFCTARPVTVNVDSGIEYRGLSAPFPLARVADFEKAFSVCEIEHFDLIYIGMFDPLLRDLKTPLRKPKFSKAVVVTKENFNEFLDSLFKWADSHKFSLLFQKNQEKETSENGSISLPNSESL